MNSPVRCPACGHIRHRLSCFQYLPWWRRLLGGLKFCGCHYWDSRWDDKIVRMEEYKVFKDPLDMKRRER